MIDDLIQPVKSPYSLFSGTSAAYKHLHPVFLLNNQFADGRLSLKADLQTSQINLKKSSSSAGTAVRTFVSISFLHRLIHFV